MKTGRAYKSVIFLLIILNFIFIYFDASTDQIEQDRIVVVDKHEEVLTNSISDGFEKINESFIKRNADIKWINTKKTDSVWYKNIKVPDVYSLSRYNYFVQKILREGNIPVKKVTEYELSNKLYYNISVNDGMPAVLELRIIKGMDPGGFRLGGNVSLIINGLGDAWGQEWVRKIIETEIPVAVGILPGRWATGTISKEALKNSKETLIYLPMEPLKGNIDKEKFRILKGMNEFTIDIVLDKIIGEISSPSGVISYKGSKVISDYSTSEALIKNLRKRNFYYIENDQDTESFSVLFSAQYGVRFYVPDAYYADDDSLEKEIPDLIRNVVEGQDMMIVIEANERNFNYITEELLKEKEINILSLSQYMRLGK